MKFKKASAKIVSLVMVVAMMIGVCAPIISAAAPDTKDFDYVSLGASNTNGYGHRGYLPALLAAKGSSLTSAGR